MKIGGFVNLTLATSGSSQSSPSTPDCSGALLGGERFLGARFEEAARVSSRDE